MKPTAIVHLTLSLLLAFLVLTACKSSSGTLTETKVIELAKREFVRQEGRTLEDYHVRLHYDAPEKYWIVWFDRKGTNLVPGQTHAVIISSETGLATFVQGE